jgi:hypothetical protein
MPRGRIVLFSQHLFYFSLTRPAPPRPRARSSACLSSKRPAHQKAAAAAAQQTQPTTKMSLDASRLAAALDASEEVPKGMSYGTAGFRAHEAKLGGIMLRMGMLAALRAAQQGKVREFFG